MLKLNSLIFLIFYLYAILDCNITLYLNLIIINYMHLIILIFEIKS